MGYNTDFDGEIKVTPPLNEQEREFLRKFSGSRRMQRGKGPYFVDGSGECGQGDDADIVDSNSPPEGQPGLWCNVVTNEDGTAIGWDGGEKTYHFAEWISYIIVHFFGSDPKAKSELPFLQPHKLNGEILAQGEEIRDRYMIVVKDNRIEVKNMA